MAKAEHPTEPSSAMQEVNDLLDQAQEKYHEVRGSSSPDRAEQFDGHLNAVRDAVQWTDDNLSNEAAAAAERNE